MLIIIIIIIIIIKEYRVERLKRKGDHENQTNFLGLVRFN